MISALDLLVWTFEYLNLQFSFLSVLYTNIQSEIFPDKNQGGRIFYNEAIMSAIKIPQVSKHQNVHHNFHITDKMNKMAFDLIKLL